MKSEKEAKSQRIWVAKELVSEKVSINESVPMSIYKKVLGISDGSRDTIQNHSMLGEWDEDFQEFEKIFTKANTIDELDKDKEQDIPLKVPKKVNVLAEMEKKKKVQEKQKQWIDQVELFQQYREIREEHALKNWQRHSVDWHRIETMVSKKTGKSAGDLLMARMGEYRKTIENRQLIEEALLLLEEENINFWKEGIKIGNDLLGLSFQIPLGGPRQPQKFKKTLSGEETRNTDLSLVLKCIDPFYLHEGVYLEAVGKSILTMKPNLAQAYVERLEKLKSAGSLEGPMDSDPEALNSQIPGNQEHEIQNGMKLIISTQRLFFQVAHNQVSTSIITIHNRGSVAIHFEWIKEKKPNPLNVKAAFDSCQRFFFTLSKGAILPGMAFDFPIVFKSSKNGIFTEKWALITQPELPKADKISVVFQGVAVEKDMHEAKRLKITKLLHRRRAQFVANEVMQTVMQRFMAYQPKYTLPFQNPNKTQFEDRNRSFELFYNPIIYAKLTALAADVYSKLPESIGKKQNWNSSVLALHSSILSVPLLEERAALMSLLNQLVAEATTIAESSHTLLTVLFNETLLDLAFKIVDTSEDLRRKMNLPVKTNNFNEVDAAFEEAEQEALRIAQQVEGKKGAVDPKKPGVVAAQPKKAVPPPAKPEVGKKAPVSKKSAEAEEDFNLFQKQTKKKPTFYQNWSPERRNQEAKYSTALYQTIREFVVINIDKLVHLFSP